VLPLVLDPSKVKVGLAGAGDALAKRRTHLAEAGVHPLAIRPDDRDGLSGLSILYIAGLEHEISAALAGRARAQGILVNVEDVPLLCDFHVPATVRRGDLLLTVSSAGRSPGLVSLIREWLSDQFGSEWSERVAEIGAKRADWRAGGLSPAQISEKTKALAHWWFG
jgi:precorrin-2 dehydrogenase / sirohydrochlorin ferrochelatase